MMQVHILSIVAICCQMVLADLNTNPSGSVFHSVPGSGFVSINFGRPKVSTKNPPKPKNKESSSSSYVSNPEAPQPSYPPVPRYDAYEPSSAPPYYKQPTLPQPKHTSIPSYAPPKTTPTPTTPKSAEPDYHPTYPIFKTTKAPLTRPLYYSQPAPNYPSHATSQPPPTYPEYHSQPDRTPKYIQKQASLPNYGTSPKKVKVSDTSIQRGSYDDRAYVHSASIPSPPAVPSQTHGPDVYLRPIYPRLETTAKPQKKASKKSKAPTLYYSQKIKFFPRPKETDAHDYTKSKPTVRPIRVKELSRIKLVPTSKGSEEQEAREARANGIETSNISPPQFEGLSAQIENLDQEGRAQKSLPSGSQVAFQTDTSSRTGRADEGEPDSSTEMGVDTSAVANPNTDLVGLASSERDETNSFDMTTTGTLSGDETTKLPIELDNIDEVTSTDASGEDSTEASQNESAERNPDEGINVSQTPPDLLAGNEEGTSLVPTSSPEETTTSTNFDEDLVVDGEDIGTLVQSDVS
ncbi:hypothetical protein TCAL_11807 [Tigriopus californicus]|uniref:Uncharacterized protein n=1 Tax=Tigriopus californicus TaxID=6832 RepID=A0A553N9E7_TIGCA|nr:uncharacterized protein LOC131885523 [Tigriopus californicus]TRY62060.1 hypothetical protein TCAL_11807 [Tigriopus californicus]|eukprot:TCALIF_11807-PA protein Name:"Protein of unknown function" AED:0.00 eAED:0.00 QI:37/1/1/1/1/1/2/67/520